MKAQIDIETPWCTVIRPRGQRQSIKAIRMVGTNRNPGRGKRVYLHIEGMNPGELFHVCGHENLRAIAHMILDGLK